MAKSKWDDIKVGDFFIADIGLERGPLLYQKILQKDNFYNAVLLNTGEPCILYIGPNTNFEKVEVTFSFKPTE